MLGDAKLRDGESMIRLVMGLTIAQFTQTGWFKLNDTNVFPGQSPRRFVESGRKFFAHAFYEPL